MATASIVRPMGNGGQRRPLLTSTSTATKTPSNATSETDAHRSCALSGPPFGIALQYPDPILRPSTTKSYLTERGRTTTTHGSAQGLSLPKDDDTEPLPWEHR